jgi:SAM-dependent methyltransferase
VDEVAVEQGRTAGVDVRCETLDEHLRRNDGRYDVVTLSHVVEHVANPVALLRAARRALRPGGTVWVATPNVAGVLARRYSTRWVGLDVPRHLVLFDPGSLRHALEAAGFADIRLRGSAGFTAHSTAVSAGVRGDEDASGRGRPLPWALRTRAAIDEWRGLRRPERGDELIAVARRP